jgi:hypothetical protein
MTRSFSLVLAGVLATHACACAPAIVAASPVATSPPSPRLLLAEAAPAPAPANTTTAPATPITPAPAPDSVPVVPGAPTPPDYGAPPPVEATPSAPPSSTKSETSEQREDRQLGRTWGWAAVSFGASAGVLAIGTSILMLEDSSTRSSNCNAQKVCNASGLTANGQLQDLGPWNAALWVVGVAGLGVGAFLLITHPTDRATGTQVGVAPNGSGASFELRSSF